VIDCDALFATGFVLATATAFKFKDITRKNAVAENLINHTRCLGSHRSPVRQQHHNGQFDLSLALEAFSALSLSCRLWTATIAARIWQYTLIIAFWG
jgi:hypothetical protein